MTYKNICMCLDGYWEKPWLELPVEQRQAWRKALFIDFEESDAGRRWDSYNLMQRQGVAVAYDAEHDPALSGRRFVDWHDGIQSMNAAMWFKRANIKPDEAAMLLWRLNPLQRDWQGNAPDPENTYVEDDKTSPAHYRALKRAFEDVAEADPKPRTLLDWLCVAMREGLRYHQWIDEYVQARIEEFPADSDGEGDAPKVGARGTAKPEWVQQALEIGTEWMLAEEKHTKKRPGIVAIAKYVEGEFKLRDIRSKRLDDYLNWQSIKKEITGITGRKPGDNFKNAMGNPQRKKHSPKARAQ